jgi:hypothetical protein
MAVSAAFGVLIGRQIANIFFLWIWVLCIAHINKSQVSCRPAQRTGTAARALRSWLLLVMSAAAWSVKSAAMAVSAAAFCVFVWLEVTYVYLWFVFLFFAHITFLQLCFLLWVASVTPNRCRPPTTFLSGRRSSKRISFSFERFCR